MSRPPLQPPETPEPAGKPRKKWLAIAIPAALVVCAAAAACILFSQRISPLLAVGKAISNLGAEAAERIGGTPLKAAAMLPDIIRDGRVTLDFSYRDPDSEEIDGSVSLLSDVEKRDFAILADVSRDGKDIGAEAYIDKERIALRSRVLDDDFYGFRYSTFRSDIRAFGGLIGLEGHTMDTLSGIVEAIGKAMDSGSGGSDPDERDAALYRDAVVAFLENLKVASANGRIVSGGASVSCREITITITDGTLIDFLNDLYGAMIADERYRSGSALLASLLQADIAGIGPPDGLYRDILGDPGSFVRDFERKYSGDITLSFFIGRGDRLLRMEAGADFLYDGMSNEAGATFDLGNPAAGCWALDANIRAQGMQEACRIAWDHDEQPEWIESSISMSRGGDELLNIRSQWSPESGALSLSYEIGSYRGNMDGAFIAGDDGFSLKCGDLSADGSGSLAFGVDAASGAQIGRIEYINLDRWGDTLLQKLEELIRNAVLRGIIY